jgi:hypothetical protein
MEMRFEKLTASWKYGLKVTYLRHVLGRPDDGRIKMIRRIMLLTILVKLTVVSVNIQAQELLTNGGLELVFPDMGGRDSTPSGWEKSEGPPVNAGFPAPNDALLMSLAEPSNFAHRLFEGEWQYWFQPYYGTFADTPDNFANLMQTVVGSPGKEYTMSGWAYFEIFSPAIVTNLNDGTEETPGSCFPEPCGDGELSPTNAYFGLDFLDSMGNVLPGSVEIELKAAGQPAGGVSYVQHTLVGVSPAGTTQVRVRATMLDGVLNPLPSPEGNSQSWFVDSFSLTAADAPDVSGDFDGDLDVDGRDFLIWQRGGSPTALSATDLAAWQAGYGAPLVAVTAVPEPASLALASLALMCVLHNRPKA